MIEDANIAIEVKNLTKTFKIPHDKNRSVKSKILGKVKNGYQELTPLDGISFTIDKGDFFGIVGRNGSGKSTLLKTIAGIYAPTKGVVKVNGTLVPFIELGVGFNPQLSGKDNVYLNGALLGFSREEIDDMYSDIVEFAELEAFMDEKLQNYSSGMQVRLAFSISIRAQGDILLLDEVLAVGDAAFQRKCYEYFEKLKAEKKTVILVSHSMSNVERFCNKALLLEEGEIKYIGPAIGATERYLALLDKPSVNGGKKLEGEKDVTDDEISTSLSILQDQKTRKTVDADKPFTAVLSLKTSQSLEHVSVALRVYDIRDNIVVAHGTLDTYGPISVKRSKQVKISFSIDNYLADGVYRVSIMVLVSEKGVRHVAVDQPSIATFRVAGAKRSMRSMFYPPVGVAVKEEK